MASLRDEITNTFRRLSGRARHADAASPFSPNPSLDETTVASDPRYGHQYGSYRILRRLGVGGMGSVYLALDTRLGRHAALKFLSPRLNSDPEMLARLQQEARTASSLNHPNILTIYDIAEADGETFIASEFVEGNTLRNALERNLIEPAAALDIARQVASALAPAHAAGIVHRDLKPSNVMLRPDGLVKVIDFGLAKFTADGSMAPYYEPVSTPGSVAGTVQYMSPEQARGESLDQRADVWSLGVILYEMLSKRHPFEGETESHVIVAILDRNVPPLKAPLGIPAAIGRVLDRALAKDPARRYQSASDFQAALDELQSPSQISRGQRLFASISHPAVAASQRRVWPYALSLLALFGAFAIWWWPLYGRERVLGPDWFTPAGYEQVTHRGDVDSATMSPDAKYIAFTTMQQDRDRVHLLNLATRVERMLPPFSGRVLGLSFSPDSRSVYYTVHDEHEWGRLYLSAIQGGETKFVLDNIDGPACFSPDGRSFLFRRRNEDKRPIQEAIVFVPIDDAGEQRLIFSKYDSEIGGEFAWTPNGKIIAAQVNKTDLQGSVRPTLTLLGPEGKIRQEFLSPFGVLSGPVWLNRGTLASFIGARRGEQAAHLREFFTMDGTWRLVPGPALKLGGLSIAASGQTMTAVTSDKTSSLYVANAGGLDHLAEWPVETRSILSFSWATDGGLLFAAQKKATVAIWASDQPGQSRLVSEAGDCMQQQPLPIPHSDHLLFASNCATYGYNSNLWQLDKSTGTATQLTFGAFFDKKPDVSPDGHTLVFNSWISNVPSIRKLSVGDQSPVQLLHFQSRNAVISPDGKFVVCQFRENYDGRWRQVIVATGDGSVQKDNLPLPVSENTPIRWSPDGKSLDFVDAAKSDSEIQRLALDSLTPRRLLNAEGKHIADFRWNQDGSRLALLSAITLSDVVLIHKSVK